MIEIAENTKQQFEQYFTEHAKAPIRIYLSPGGCSGPKLALGLDDQKDDDEVMEAEGLTFLVNKDLFEKAKPFAIEGVGMGIKIKSSLQLGDDGCSSCDGCG